MTAGPIEIYLHQLVRAVRGGAPVVLGKEHDPTALLAICTRLVECEEALAILNRKGWVKPGQSIADAARQLPDAKP